MTDTEEAENEMKEAGWIFNEEKAEEKRPDTETAPVEDDFRVQMDLNDINDVPDIQVYSFLF